MQMVSPALASARAYSPQNGKSGNTQKAEAGCGVCFGACSPNNHGPSKSNPSQPKFGFEPITMAGIGCGGCLAVLGCLVGIPLLAIKLVANGVKSLNPFHGKEAA